MPRLNSRGDVLQGLGLVWFTDDSIIGQRAQPDGSWAVCSAPSLSGPWTVLSARGCNFIAAGGGNWAAFGGGLFGPAAVPGAAIPAGQDGRGAGSPDGTIALIADPEHGGLLLQRSDGSTLLWDGFPTDRICVVDRSRALWVDARDGQIHTCGDLPVPLTLPGPVLWPSVFRALGTWWIAYHSTDAIGYVCHPFNSLSGYRICLPPAFYPHGIALSENVALFAWSVAPGEPLSALRVADQSLTAPRVPLGGAAPLPPVPVPQPTPEPIQMQGLTAAQFATLERIRAQYPSVEDIKAKRADPLTPAQIGAMLNDTCWVHRAEGLGMQAKPGGTNAIQPRTGIGIWNGIRIGNVGQDVLGAASIGVGIPVRGEVGPADPATFVAPVEPLGAVPAPAPVPVPTPTPVPPPAPTVDLSAVLAELKALRVELTQMRFVLSAVSQDADTLIARQTPAPVVKFPTYKGQLSLRGTVTLEPQS